MQLLFHRLLSPPQQRDYLATHSQRCLRTTHSEGGESLILEKRNTVIMLEGGGDPELRFENMLTEVLEVITNKGRRYLQHWDLHQYIQ